MYRVHGHSGEFHLEATDLRIRGGGMDLVWTRTYRSRADGATPMGSGWDHSYNIWIEPAGRHLRLHDGHGRSDVLWLQPDGTWSRREPFAVLEKESSGGLAPVYADGRRWQFRALCAATAPGRIDRIQDRNGNAIWFSYDTTGPLITVHDTLDSSAHDRDIKITYNDDGMD